MKNNKAIELTITPNYVSDWDFCDAVRELIQNGIDQELLIQKMRLIFHMMRKKRHYSYVVRSHLLKSIHYYLVVAQRQIIQIQSVSLVRVIKSQLLC